MNIFLLSIKNLFNQTCEKNWEIIQIVQNHTVKPIINRHSKQHILEPNMLPPTKLLKFSVKKIVKHMISKKVTSVDNWCLPQRKKLKGRKFILTKREKRHSAFQKVKRLSSLYNCKLSKYYH